VGSSGDGACLNVGRGRGLRVLQVQGLVPLCSCLSQPFLYPVGVTAEITHANVLLGFVEHAALSFSLSLCRSALFLCVCVFLLVKGQGKGLRVLQARGTCSTAYFWSVTTLFILRANTLGCDR